MLTSLVSFYVHELYRYEKKMITDIGYYLFDVCVSVPIHPNVGVSRNSIEVNRNRTIIVMKNYECSSVDRDRGVEIIDNFVLFRITLYII